MIIIKRGSQWMQYTRYPLIIEATKSILISLLMRHSRDANKELGKELRKFDNTTKLISHFSLFWQGMNKIICVKFLGIYGITKILTI